MRKLISILLLFSLFVLLFGYHLAFYFQISSVKAEMMAFLKSQKDCKDVIRFSFNHSEKNQLEWEDEMEFRYNGEMYDVLEKKQNGNQLTISCIADKKETELLQEYQKNTKDNRSNSFLQLIAVQFLLPAEPAIGSLQIIITKDFFNHSSPLADIASSIIIPPPRVY